MRIRAYVRNMASNEIARMVGEARMRQIKLVDPHPVFKAFVVGHEGEAQGYVVGVGNIVKRWFRATIEKLHDRIKEGIAIFNGHGETNDQSGRVPIGQVVGKKLENVGNRLSAVVACYIFPEFRHLPLDVASIEASVDIEESRDGFKVVDVGEVTAIALANRLVETPGFPGATLLGQLQAFAKSDFGGERMTLEEMKDAVREMGLKPSDLFRVEHLAEDPSVKGFLGEATKKALAEEYWARKRDEAKWAEEQKKVQAEIEAVKAENKGLKTTTAKSLIPGLFEKKKADRKLDEKQAKFILKRLDKFEPPEEGKDLDKALDKHMDDELDEYMKLASDVFGIVPPPGGEKKGSEPKEGGDEPPDLKYSDPNLSPLL